MALLLTTVLLTLSQPAWFIAVSGAHVPWYVALACPILDKMTSVASLAPHFVVKLVHAERHPCAIHCELAFGAEEVYALWQWLPIRGLCWSLLDMLCST